MFFNPDPVESMTKYFPLYPSLFVDVETTGLDPGKGLGVIVSVGAVFQRHDGSTPPSETPINTFNVEVLPTEEEWENASPQALKLNGMTWEFLEEHGVPLAEAELKFISWIIKYGATNANHTTLIGQNIKFDINFLQNDMPNLGLAGFPFKNYVDNIKIFKHLKQYDDSLNTHKANSHHMSRELGVEEEDKVHTALGGALAAYRNYWAMQKLINDYQDEIILEVAGGNFERGIALPRGVKTFDDWAKWAKNNGWERFGRTHKFISPKPEGQRYSFLVGTPSILVKL